MGREEFKQEAKQSIDTLFVKIDELEAKKDKAEGKAKAEYEDALNTLKRKKTELQMKYEKLNNVSDDKWEEAKSSFSSAADSFKEGLSKMASMI